MEIGALNSLAEVGVGLNLAFTLLHPVRKMLQGLLSRRLAERKVVISALLTDICNKNNNKIKPKDVEAIDNIEGQTVTLFSYIEIVGVVLSVLASFSLIYFLYEASLDPVLKINSCWAEITLIVVVLPVATNFTLQTLVWAVATSMLAWKERGYRKAFEMLDNLIEPTDPTSN